MAHAARLLCGISLASLAVGACIHRASSKNTRTVPASMLEPSRLAGIRDIQPDAGDASAMSSAGQEVTAVLELCLHPDGSPERISIIRSSGHGGYDLKLATGMADWRYRPFLVAGKPKPVCAKVTFTYPPGPQPSARGGQR